MVTTRIPLEERFWSKVDRSGGPDACWLWTASVFRKRGGYGQFSMPGGRVVKAHRLAYELEIGEPGKLFVCHECDTPRCCNPRHLFLGTNADNIADMDRKGRRRSHSYRGEGHHQAKLSEKDILAIRERASAGETGKAIAADFGISGVHANRIIRRDVWKHL